MIRRSPRAARESAGLWRHDGVVLNVSRVELMKAQTPERGMPIMVVVAQVQYIHTVRNKKVSRPAPGPVPAASTGPVHA